MFSFIKIICIISKTIAKMLVFFICVLQNEQNRGGSRAAATSKMERFVIIVSGMKYLNPSSDVSNELVCRVGPALFESTLRTGDSFLLEYHKVACSQGGIGSKCSQFVTSSRLANPCFRGRRGT